MKGNSLSGSYRVKNYLAFISTDEKWPWTPIGQQGS
jgi:hypothetical protein